MTELHCANAIAKASNLWVMNTPYQRLENEIEDCKHWQPKLGRTASQDLALCELVSETMY